MIGAEHRDEPTIAMRAYAGNGLAVAVGGVVDSGMLDRLRALSDDPRLAGPSGGELVLDLSQVQHSVPGLTTVLDQLCRRRAREGCRVELRSPPSSLADELEGATLTEAFTIFDAVHRAPPWAAYLSPGAGGRPGRSPGGDASMAPSSAASRLG
ncbi:STAS domain-containing protein [Actinomycetospora lemnae]|uniref:STAS domain-containing protein n=1 Tax=Actinomycetospora lemnae TaxID=3019891 RepID=A0ABT5SZ86_9PSEU|nr:hypothetical protein [Actinomycetospora sp. DW7H6]MDD7968109.1 hypothetical protein [Actinomycetospora sp. DW7H6]